MRTTLIGFDNLRIPRSGPRPVGRWRQPRTSGSAPEAGRHWHREVGLRRSGRTTPTDRTAMGAALARLRRACEGP